MGSSTDDRKSSPHELEKADDTIMAADEPRNGDSETGSESDASIDDSVGSFGNEKSTETVGSGFRSRERAHDSVHERSMAADVLGEDNAKKPEQQDRSRRPEMVVKSNINRRVQKEDADDGVPARSRSDEILDDSSENSADASAHTKKKERTAPRRKVDRSVSSKDGKSRTRSPARRTASSSMGGAPTRGVPRRTKSGDGLPNHAPSRSISPDTKENAEDQEQESRPSRVLSIGDVELDEDEFEKALKRETSRRDMRPVASRSGSRRNLLDGPSRSGSRRNLLAGQSRSGSKRNLIDGNERVSRESSKRELSRNSSKRDLNRNGSRGRLSPRVLSRRNLKDGDTASEEAGGSRQGSRRDVRAIPSRSNSRRNFAHEDDEAKQEDGTGEEQPKRRGVTTSRSFRHNREETRARLRRAASNRELGESSTHGARKAVADDDVADGEGQLKKEGSVRRLAPEKRRVGRALSGRRDNREVMRSQYAAAIDCYARQDDDEEEESEKEECQEVEEVKEPEESAANEGDAGVSKSKISLRGLAKGMTKVATKAAKSVVPRMKAQKDDCLLDDCSTFNVEDESERCEN